MVIFMKDLNDIIIKLRSARIIDKGTYKYVILPFDYAADPEEVNIFVKNMVKKIRNNVDTNAFDKIITIETKGIVISTVIALEMKKSLFIIRKRKYNIEGEKEVKKTTGYEESIVYINGIKRGDRVIIVDDLISTGGTLKATISALLEIGAEIKGVFAIFDKPDLGGTQQIKSKYNFPVVTLIKLRTLDDKRLEAWL